MSTLRRRIEKQSSYLGKEKVEDPKAKETRLRQIRINAEQSLYEKNGKLENTKALLKSRRKAILTHLN